MANLIIMLENKSFKYFIFQNNDLSYVRRPLYEEILDLMFTVIPLHYPSISK